MAQNYKGYKRNKKLQSGLFWGVVFGILAAIIIPVILITTSLGQIDKQREELEIQLREDFNDIDLFPNNFASDDTSPYSNTNDFIEQTSINLESETPFTTSKKMKEEYLNINQAFALPLFSVLLPALDNLLSTIADPKANTAKEFSNPIGVQEVGEGSAPVNLNSAINYKDEGGLTSKNLNGLIAVELSSEEHFPIFEKNTVSLNLGFLGELLSKIFPDSTLISSLPFGLASIQISSIRVVNSIVDDGKYWWDHNEDTTYSIQENEYKNIGGEIDHDVWYFDVSLKIPPISRPLFNFEVSDPTINFMYQINLFERSNKLSNLLIGIGLIESTDENGDKVYDLDYSNSFFTITSWLDYVSDEYNTSELRGMYKFIYSDDSLWRDAWNELFNEELKIIDLEEALPTINNSDLTLERIRDPDFEMFFEIMYGLNLIFDKRFGDARQAILENMIDTVDLKDLPYPY